MTQPGQQVAYGHAVGTAPTDVASSAEKSTPAASSNARPTSSLVDVGAQPRRAEPLGYAAPDAGSVVTGSRRWPSRAMRAAVQTRYGSPEVVRVVDAPVPVVGAGDVRVAVHAT